MYEKIFSHFLKLIFICFFLFVSLSLATDFIIDDGDPIGYSEVGTWTVTSAYPGYYGTTYRYVSQNPTSTTRSATWRPNIDTAGNYEVFTWYVAGSNRSTSAQYIVQYNGGTSVVWVNQRTNGSQWVSLGIYPFAQGTGGSLTLTNFANPTSGLVIADAAKFVYRAPATPQQAEFRAIWIDAFGPGFKNSTQATALINTVRNYNFNAIIPEIRFRGNSYYRNSPYEPIAPDLAAGFDALSTLIALAHDTSGGKRRIEVHAWIVTYLLWTDTTKGPPQSTPQHLFYAHPEWFMRDSSGIDTTYGNEFWLDPGIPAVQDHLFKVTMHIVTTYDIDGIHFDYIRYPAVTWGYNSIAVARFNAEYGRTGMPVATDSVWRAWRRRQITEFLKKVYANVMAVKPWVKISVASANRGYTGPDAWNEAYNHLLQDWKGWFREGIIDFNAAMVYKDTYSAFTNIISYVLSTSLSPTYGRHNYIGQGAYMNPVSLTLSQLSAIRHYQTINNLPLGQIIYDYADTNSEGTTNTVFYQTIKDTLYYSSVTVPIMSWKNNPTKGIFKGTVTYGNSSIELCRVTLKQDGNTISVTSTDGTGFYAFLNINPGTYTLEFYKPGYPQVIVSNQSVIAGGVTTVDVNLSSEVPNWRAFSSALLAFKK